MVKTTEDIRKIIDDDLDWFFNVGDIKEVNYEKNLKGEWDYVLKIKFTPPSPMQLLKMQHESQSFKEMMDKYGHYDSSG